MVLNFSVVYLFSFLPSGRGAAFREQVVGTTIFGRSGALPKPASHDPIGSGRIIATSHGVLGPQMMVNSKGSSPAISGKACAGEILEFGQIGSMGLGRTVYLPTWMVDFQCKCR